MDFLENLWNGIGAFLGFGDGDGADTDELARLIAQQQAASQQQMQQMLMMVLGVVVVVMLLPRLMPRRA